MPTRSLIIALLFVVGSFAANAQMTAPVRCSQSETSYGLPCTKQQLTIAGTTKITVKVYTKGAVTDRTFVVVHANEEKGLDAAKRMIAKHSGRLVELVSKDPADPNHLKNIRHLYFGDNNCVDPNRIYTRVGIIKTLKDVKNRCNAIADPPPGLVDQIAAFSRNLLKIVTNGNRSRLIISVHNNDDSLSPDNWSIYPNGDVGGDFKSAVGVFKGNNHANNTIYDTGAHNFVMATNGRLFGTLLDSGIHESILQEGFMFLTEPDPAYPADIRKRKLIAGLDDGSMSIYFGATLYKNLSTPFDYIIVEAGGKANTEDANKTWQSKVIEKLIKIKF